MDSVEKAIIKRGLYKRAHDSRARRGTKSEKENESSRSGNDTRAEGVDIRLSNEPEPMNEESGENICENEKCELQKKIVELKKILSEEPNDFDDVKLELSNKTAKIEAYFEKLENTKVFLERQLARKVDDSKAKKDQFLKKINHLRTQLENLKGKSVETKFDKPSILGKPLAEKLLITSQLSKSWFTPKVVMQKDLSKPVST
ncbi:hypothetical protein Tco_1162335 [Tanacetum coccineum]